ncbi:MAG: Ni/Fe hydrogenase subunit alpha [Armatimonadetes bacterium]|nr:Ni/Fe hydrogenase subunit alpha [Armatimonadota bacterium]MDW8027421.1 Ni/Fe hydrogenase subunit alpha [Armatimonadota bacterium]
MAQQIVIEPVTRIEGHAKITIKLDEEGNVADAWFHVTQLRGFEKLCEGRPFSEMPSLMARICGICPVSHSIASAKACDQLLAVRIPEPAVKLRRLINLAQILQSHALSFFHLSAPDLLLGFDSDPQKRNLFGLIEANPQMAKDGIKLRKIGQSVIEILAGKRIHPSWIVPGGVSEPLNVEKRDAILAMLPEAKEITLRTLQWFKFSLEKFRDEIRAFANFPSLFMGLVTSEGKWECYHGRIRVVDGGGHIVADQLDPTEYQDYIGEATEPWTYLKFPYYKPKGYPNGMYRVGPLARLNIIDGFGTDMADQEWAEFRELERGAVLSSFYYHYARLIEILHTVEKMEELLNDPDILSKHVRASAGLNNLEGIGVAEAPRGILFHHYKVNEEGLMEWANLIIATGHNNLAMSKGILQASKHFVKGKQLSEGMLNRVEAVIRAFDPCLSCSTHAVGHMPLHIQLIGPDGTLLDELRRD